MIRKSNRTFLPSIPMNVLLRAALCGAALLHCIGAPAADVPARWVAAWATALQAIPDRPDLPPLYLAPAVAGRTVRQIVYPTLNGSAIRLRISNAYGPEPLVIDDVRVARSTGGAAVWAGGVRVTFGGRPAVVLPPGGVLNSDPVAFDIVAGKPYAVSMAIGAEQRMFIWHRIAGQVNYVSAPGDHAGDAAGDAYRTRFTQSAWVAALSVAAPSAGTLVAVGDSITDGMRASLNLNRRWPDALARRLARAGDRSIAVVDVGISGNRLLSDSPCYGAAVVKRFERDVLEQDGVRAAILLIGINDIDFAVTPIRRGLDCDAPHTAVTADALIDGYRRLIDAAHRHGVRLFGGTLTPAALPPRREAIRVAVNQWIRTSGAFDGVVDFDAALRDPAHPERLQRTYDSGDHIHPSDAGYAAMADAVPLDAVRRAMHP